MTNLSISFCLENIVKSHYHGVFDTVDIMKVIILLCCEFKVLVLELLYYF